ncbi:MAG: protease modulator HflK family protein, partial [Verrucomicrobiae bacterium]|nr:protease modulator HflK family protein [Verrucomicrobiae bacterium]
MDRSLSKTGLVNWLMLLIGGITVLVFAERSATATGELAAAFIGIATLTALMAWFQMNLSGREEAERLELEDLSRSRADSGLFAASAAEVAPARRAREQFERWIVPAFTLLLFASESFGVWYFWKRLEKPDDMFAKPAPAALSLAIFAAVSFVLFLLGRYSARLAQLESSTLLRPSGSAILLGALVSAIAAVASGLDWAGFGRWDRYLALGMTALLGLIAIETLFGLVFELYRPRVRGRELRLLYESRIIGLLGQSGGLFNTAAQALDYQFGFKVSDTWFYRYLEQSLSGFALVWVAILWVSSCIVVLEPAEQALLERFGKPVAGREVLDPGLHLKLPWPIDAAIRYNTRELRTFLVGAIPDPNLEKNRVLVWTSPHYKEEFNLLVASDLPATNAAAGAGETAVPVNLLTASVPVQYRIRDVRQWGYQAAEPDALLERIASSEVVRYLVSVNMDQIMSHGRLDAAREMKERIQAEADDAQLGAEILFVGLQDIHPPTGTKTVPVAAAYEQVVGARSEMQARIYEAEAYRQETLPKAAAQAVARTNAAHAAAAQ